MRTLIAVLVVLGVVGVAQADKPVSVEQIQLCYELGETSKYFRECHTDVYREFVKACDLRPTITIDPEVLKIPNGAPTAIVDSVLSPLEATCNPAYAPKMRALTRSKLKGVHIKLVPVPVRNASGYPRPYTFENGIVEIGTFTQPESGYYSDPNVQQWIYEQLFGNPNGLSEKPDPAEVAKMRAASSSGTESAEPPVPTAEQKKRIARLLTSPDIKSIDLSSTKRSCIATGDLCRADQRMKCCSGKACSYAHATSKHVGSCE